jgi:hypothetical protein
MKNIIIAVLTMVGISLFCGVIVIAIGIGSAFPQLDQIAGPIVCGNNELQIVQHVSHYQPGETNWTISAYCVDDKTSEKRDVTNLVQLVAGAIYSVISLIVVVGFAIKYRNISSETTNSSKAVTGQTIAHKDSGDAEERLEKLKELRGSNLISEEDYQKKKGEILNDL